MLPSLNGAADSLPDSHLLLPLAKGEPTDQFPAHVFYACRSQAQYEGMSASSSILSCSAWQELLRANWGCCWLHTVSEGCSASTVRLHCMLEGGCMTDMPRHLLRGHAMMPVRILQGALQTGGAGPYPQGNYKAPISSI